MTPSSALHAMVPLVADLARELPETERYRRLLLALRGTLPCDAAALLRLEGDCLVPLAVDGLSSDTLGRRFRLAEHPRFEALVEAGGAMRFPPGSPLPDPYDGLVEGAPGKLEVHDCAGCVLQLGDRPWGLLTLDALEAGRFSDADLDALQAFAALAAATVTVAARIDQLALNAELYREAAGGGQRRLIGQSAAHRQLLREIEVVAASDLTVLIQGETGTGKELVAQALHAQSRRAGLPIVSLNCAALPDTLVESELFGHVRGAFSGAIGERRGKFEMADGGTLFLDEVGELSLGAQAKLLRVLQSGQLQRLGSDREHRVDVRLIAATNRDLGDEVRAGRLRADFYHRLSVYPIRVPPLRERGRDVLLISGFFLEENRSRLGLGSLRLDAGAQAALLAYPWPGNVRELEHLVGRSVLQALSRHPQRPRILTLTAEDLGLAAAAQAAPLAGPAATAAAAAAPTPAPAAAPGLTLKQAVEDFERQQVGQCLARHQGRWAAAARELGMDRANLRRLARRLGIGEPAGAVP